MWDPYQYFFWYKPLFVVQLMIAESLFTLNLSKKDGFWARFLGGSALAIAVSFALPVLYNAAYCAIAFLVMFTFSVAVLKFSYDESLKNVLFCAIAGYTVQHVSSELYELFNVIANVNGNLASDLYGSGTIDIASVNWFAVTLYVWIYGMVYWGSYMLVGRKINKYGVQKLSASTMFVLGAALVFMDVIFSSIITYAIPADSDKLAVSMLHLYNIICCVLALYLSFLLPRQISLEKEMSIVKQINYRQKKQYETSMENVALINYKCHDLKHQIRLLEDNDEAKSEAVSEIETLVSDYDAICKTGNDALDVALTEKSLLCRKLGIRFVCMADGARIAFMKEADVYSLFGNMMDNAIDAVKDFPEGERTISLNVKKVEGFVIISLRNRYKGKLVFKDDLPQTTKKNHVELHGFGMKSMQYTVRNYGGEMTVVTSDGVFNLNIAFPVPA